MKAVIIDALQTIEGIKYLLEKYGVRVAGAFSHPKEGFEFIIHELPDIVFLGVELPMYNGLDLGMQIRQCCFDIFIIYVSAYSEYAKDAFQSYPFDYIMKPIDESRFKATIERLRRLITTASDTPRSKLGIKCFGNFKLFNDNAELALPARRAKELLAFLLCHYQQALSKEEIVNALFNSSNTKRNMNNLRVTLFRLRHFLMEHDIQKDKLLIREDFSIEVQPGICDFADFINFMNNNTHINEYNADQAYEIIEAIEGGICSATCLKPGSQISRIQSIYRWRTY